LRAAHLLAVIIVIVLGLVGGALVYFMFSTTNTLSPRTSPTPTVTTTSPTQPKVSDVISGGFVVVGDDEVCWRIKIYGEVDLRDKVTVNGIYGVWFGRINVTHPGREEVLLYEPGNYADVLTQFFYLSGTKVLDACVHYWTWDESPWPEGIYRVVVWLYHSPGIYVTLFEKSFNFTMNLKASVSPTTWRRWNETLRLTIANTGSVPIYIMGGSIYLEENPNLVIGWWQQTPPTDIVLPGQTKELVGPALVRDEFVENLRGRVATVKMVLGILTAQREYSIVTDIRFPS
jgi:hypothetical protein